MDTVHFSGKYIFILCVYYYSTPKEDSKKDRMDIFKMIHSHQEQNHKCTDNEYNMQIRSWVFKKTLSALHGYFLKDTVHGSRIRLIAK